MLIAIAFGQQLGAEVESLTRYLADGYRSPMNLPSPGLGGLHHEDKPPFSIFRNDVDWNHEALPDIFRAERESHVGSHAGADVRRGLEELDGHGEGCGDAHGGNANFGDHRRELPLTQRIETHIDVTSHSKLTDQRLRNRDLHLRPGTGGQPRHSPTRLDVLVHLDVHRGDGTTEG